MSSCFPSAHQSSSGMFFWLRPLLASSRLTEDQPDNVISWPIRCLDPYLIPQVGFPTDEPVEGALLLLGANQWAAGDVIQHQNRASRCCVVFVEVMLCGDSMSVSTQLSFLSLLSTRIIWMLLPLSCLWVAAQNLLKYHFYSSFHSLGLALKISRWMQRDRKQKNKQKCLFSVITLHLNLQIINCHHLKAHLILHLQHC